MVVFEAADYIGGHTNTVSALLNLGAAFILQHLSYKSIKPPSVSRRRRFQ
jgi:predicted NAD/FAD-binding protein